jgi:hypothetical protein
LKTIKYECDSDGEACQEPHCGEYLFIDIKQEHCLAPVAPVELVIRNEDQVRIVLYE